MERTQKLIIGGISFGQNIVGIVTRPYETYRRIIERGSLTELGFIGILLALYFAIASVVRTAAFRPFLLTKQFILLYSGAVVGFAVIVAALWTLSKVVGGKGDIGAVARGWAYTLVPTVCWFMVTSLLYVVLPPPRTASVPGIVFSVIFLLFSATMFWWKITLAYLTLRFSMRLDLAKIIVVGIGTSVVVTLFSVWMYNAGVFRVPFI
jgi:hypothetical protein